MIEPYFPHKNGSEQFPGGALTTVQGNLERFLSMIRFDIRGKLDDLLDFQMKFQNFFVNKRSSRSRVQQIFQRGRI